MKKIIVFITLLFFIKPIFPILDFIINYDAIQEICINKNSPTLQCNGSCYLKKNLAKTAQEDNPITEKKSHQLHLEILFFNPNNWPSTYIAFIDSKNKVVDSYNVLYSFLASQKLPKPPSF